MNRHAALTVPLLALVLLGAGGQPVEGYRYPTDSDYKEEWKPYRAQAQKPFHVVGDFNGDGLKDDAWTLIALTTGESRFVVFFGRKSGGPEMVDVFDQYGDPDPCTTVLRLIPPGRHRVHCGVDFGDCKTEAVVDFNFKNPGLAIDWPGGQTSMMTWDPDKHVFLDLSVDEAD